MGVAPTGSIYKTLEFDGESSRSYGVYITGEAVFNAPERDVEMISIAGRNGSFALDKGRFQNITVTYPAGIFADTEDEFRTAISEFRNFLCSKNGYVRLTDDYNPTEYRMAIYKSGLEVTPAMLQAGQFEISFECKPQRWMLSGESGISLTSGDTLYNPSLFASSPLLEVEGYGEILINGESVTIYNKTIGNVTISGTTKNTNSSSDTSIKTLTLSVDYSAYSSAVNSGDTITGRVGCRMTSRRADSSISITEIDGASVSFAASTGLMAYNITRQAFTNSTVTYTKNRAITLSNGTSFTETTTFTITNTTAGVLTLTMQVSQSTDVSAYCLSYASEIYAYTLTASSTVSALGNPLYIDLDIGEAYKVEGNETVSLNNSVSLPAELPKLSSGSNTITYDNTITDLKVVPRWWKV